MKSKKAEEGIIWTSIIIILLLTFFLVYSGVWTKLFGRGVSSMKDQYASAGDFDKDNIINLADKCPCKSGDIENDGCPAGYKITDANSGFEDRSCLTKTT